MKILYTEPTENIYKALNKIKKSGVRCLIVVKKKKFLGTLSDGDIRNNISHFKKTSRVENFYNKNAKYLLEKNFNKKQLENLLIKKVLDLVPICDRSMIIKKVILRSNYIKNPEAYWKKKTNIPVVIMSGGEGTRLRPITNIIPKPLIPLGKSTVLEQIISNFRINGFEKILISINYFSELVTTYLIQKGIKNIKFIKENKKLGTIGAIGLLANNPKNIIVTNCDVIFKINFNNYLKFHNENKNDITIVVAERKFSLPYGVCNIKNNNLENIIEKPKYKFLINTGMYILKNTAIKLIKKNQKLDFDQLIKKAQKKNLKIGTFLISDKNWQDTGEFNKLEDTLKNL
tara:strand:- start:8604 stop:9638 length:1035 start_codon:yes stop_codon:yes gene_type:complete